MSDKQNLNKELKTNLEKDELLIWSEFPKQSFQIVFEDLIIIPLLSIILFLGFYLFTISLNNLTNKELLPISVLMILGSFYIIYSRFIQKVISQKKSIYALTTKRVIILVGKELEFQNLSDIKDISFVEHPFTYKYGSIIFGEPENIFGSSNEPFKSKYILGYRGGINLKRDNFSFDFITETKTIFQLIESKINK